VRWAGRLCAEGAKGGPYTAPVPGQMYDPAVQLAMLEQLARWGSLPEFDLIRMLSAVERLRFRPEALEDLEWDGLVEIRSAGDERVVRITAAGTAWLHQQGRGAAAHG